jgi:hypothetical protein
MRRFKSITKAQKIVTTYASVANLLNLGRDKVSAEQYRNLRESVFDVWENAVI